MTLLTVRSCEVRPERVFGLFICISAMIICGIAVYGRLTRSRFEELRAGMTVQEVHNILGNPDITCRYEEVEEWSYIRPHQRIDVSFRNGRLFDADGGKGYDLADNSPHDASPAPPAR